MNHGSKFCNKYDCLVFYSVAVSFSLWGNAFFYIYGNVIFVNLCLNRDTEPYVMEKDPYKLAWLDRIILCITA